MSWEELALQASIGRETLRRIREGAGGPKAVRNVEAVLGWRVGSMTDIDEGGEPTVDEVVPAPAHVQLGALTEDYPARLRALRVAMGPAAFWREVGAMQAEEDARATGS